MTTVGPAQDGGQASLCDGQRTGLGEWGAAGGGEQKSTFCKGAASPAGKDDSDAQPTQVMGSENTPGTSPAQHGHHRAGLRSSPSECTSRVPSPVTPCDDGHRETTC